MQAAVESDKLTFIVRSRRLRISLLLFLLLWFGVVIPLHPRGVIRLAGACSEGGRACCRQSKGPDHDRKPLNGSGDCAICYFVATLDLPPAITIDLPKLGLLEIIDAPAPLSAAVSDANDLIEARGPPMA